VRPTTSARHGQRRQIEGQEVRAVQLQRRVAGAGWRLAVVADGLHGVAAVQQRSGDARIVAAQIEDARAAGKNLPDGAEAGRERIRGAGKRVVIRRELVHRPVRSFVIG